MTLTLVEFCTLLWRHGLMSMEEFVRAVGEGTESEVQNLFRLEFIDWLTSYAEDAPPGVSARIIGLLRSNAASDLKTLHWEFHKIIKGASTKA